MKRNASITGYNHFSKCLFASFPDLVSKRNWRVEKNMKYGRHYIYVEHSVIYKRFAMHLIGWQRGRTLKMFALIKKQPEFARWLLMPGKAAGTMLREAQGVSVWTRIDGSIYLPCFLLLPCWWPQPWPEGPTSLRMRGYLALIWVQPWDSP